MFESVEHEERISSHWMNKIHTKAKEKEELIKEKMSNVTKSAQKYEIDSEYNIEEREAILPYEDEEGFIEREKDLQSLISSLSQIPQTYCEKEDKEKEEEEEESEEVLEDKEDKFDLNSICGLHDVKQNLLNVFIYPIMYPHLFPRKIQWNKILLYGPPGTGKTMLAKAIANEINATFYRVSSADLLSHWQGETEKQIRNLFENVRENAEPTILFFDEIDGLCRRRTNTEEDGVRRIKTELLTHLDDNVSDADTNRVYVIGATNCPWEIDSGFMRRFHKKIFVPLPDKEARLDIIKKSFDDVETELTDFEWDDIGKSTEGYSGSDLVNVVMSSCCERFMQIKNCKYWEVKDDLLVPAALHFPFTLQMNFEDIHPTKEQDLLIVIVAGSDTDKFLGIKCRCCFVKHILKKREDIPMQACPHIGIRNIIFSDLKAAIANTPKTVGREEMFKYLEFAAEIK